MDETDAMSMVRGVRAALHSCYPGYLWHVEAEKMAGIIHIYLVSLSLDFGMELHMTRSQFELEERAKYLGGELLERFQLSRERAVSLDHFQKDHRGNAIVAAQGEA
jgi:hypothetical protein